MLLCKYWTHHVPFLLKEKKSRSPSNTRDPRTLNFANVAVHLNNTFDQISSSVSACVMSYWLDDGCNVKKKMKKKNTNDIWEDVYK